jgi:hypothetical protein
MASWNDFETAAPGLAGLARGFWDAFTHKTVATIRADGGPRISGNESAVVAGEVWLAGMPGARRFADLRRDPRVAVHSGSPNPETWRGDTKLTGRAVPATPAELVAHQQATGSEGGGEYELFRIDLESVTVVRLGEPADHLLVETWRAGRDGTTVVRR